jgi:asparagine synthetase B (glutamine-hydrolysing)
MRQVISVNISVTREPLHGGDSAERVVRSQCGHHHVAVVSSYAVQVIEDDQQWLVKGFPPYVGDSTGNAPLFSVSVGKATRSLRVERSTGFGLPLFFHINDRGEFFAATHLGHLRDAGVSITENTDALPEFYLYRCLMPPATFFKDVQRLYHGGSLVVSLAGARCTVVQHEPASFLRGPGPSSPAVPFSHRVSDLVDRLRSGIAGLKDAPGATALLMSGGIDSSMTAVLARTELGIDRTYSTAYPFESPALDMESRYAKSAAAALEFQHEHYIGTCRDYRRALIVATSLAEEPVHHLQSPCMHMLFTAGMGSGVRTIVQGLGAGGVFGNFRNHLYLRDKAVYRLLALEPFRSMLGVVSQVTGRGRVLYGKLGALSNHSPLEALTNPLWAWHLYGSRQWVGDRFDGAVDAVIHRQLQELQRTKPATLYDLWARYSLLGDEDATLAINSKIAAGSGLYLHSPLYSADILEAALSIPWGEKMHSPENRLRKAMAAEVGVPAFIRNRRKTGFGVKRGDWALEGGVFSPFADLVGNVIDLEEFKATRQSTSSMAMTFWCLLTYALWKRLVIQQEPVERLLSELDEAEDRHLSADPAW